ncbi:MULTISPECIES: LysR family transcriptional regulator [Sphingobium]|jgi:DNA-binding transcriptional LysR family regulator|uniref:LysR family transcriptional regulator n=1 Tax=Sphingobium yanoikuyae TaxID=13690 RepID=A0A0J9CZE5_SPHYA|nr:MULTISPECIES: LysR family transcriptional regulator [Sphingobium]ATP19979.1 LysR family transcriptional regulator [Sphingobium yanoikuyae]KMW29756.1 LysR family transcriptional regulator [Sphingobium yanoikuyae]MBR2267179.1 LysR family transcriptional regulator [Sphingobium sp.]QCB39306.1 LysR family transcriptional regulator [Sphingobium sp. PAMC28499]
MSNRAHRFHAPMIVYFDAIRRAGSVREAARRLNVASSAVNRQLLKLEEELGTPLFDRLPGGLKLTHAGATFARHAIEVLQDAERVRSELEAMQGLRSGHVEIAAVEALTSGLLPDVLAQLRERHPRITVGVSVLGSAAISAAVIGGDADMGIAFGVERTSDLRQLSHSRHPLGATMRPDHPLARSSSLTLATCLSHSLILPKADLSIRQQLQRALGKLPQGAVETSSVELAKQLTMRGLGISFQTRIGIEDEIERGELVHIPIAGPTYLQADLGIYVRSARNPAIAVHALVELLNAALARCANAASEAEPAAPPSST